MKQRILVKDLVSIIMPSYNSEKYIQEAIDSVINQVYKDWELIIVDDCSTDDTINIVKKNMKLDERIVLLCLEKNKGTASARNFGIDFARGRYIAFLDSDDVWLPEKLSKQISFMKTHGYVFTFHAYCYWLNNNKLVPVRVPRKIDYDELLKGNSTGSCLAVCIDHEQIKDIHMTNEKHEDYICWLNILKNYKVYGYGIDEVLGYYRVGHKSESSNKLKSVYWTWKVYRNNQKLGILKSMYCMFFYVVKAIKKRRKNFLSIF